ncbi:MAG: rhodanese-like domain-containing protein [Bacteroidota bacterium]
MKEITVSELKAMRDSGEDFQLIDVREPHEFDIANIGGELIPMATAVHSADKIATDKKVIIHCRSGARSGAVIKHLESTFGMENLYNLKGGIMAWSKEIDPSLQVS